MDSEIIIVNIFLIFNFSSRGLKFINLAIIFEDKSVISIIPGYFEN